MRNHQEDSELENKVEGWQEIPRIGELNQELLVILCIDIALYNDAKGVGYFNGEQIKGMEWELDNAFLHIREIKEKAGEKYAGSIWDMLHQQYRSYENCEESRMKVEACR